MCIGIPMRVMALESGFARVAGRGESRRVNTALVGPCEVGEWLLVFLDDARERLDPSRAAEVNATLDLMEMAMGWGTVDVDTDPGFVLPSSLNAATLQQITGS